MTAEGDTVCSACGVGKSKSDFSKAQLKKKDARKCKDCVEGVTTSTPPVGAKNDEAAVVEEKKVEEGQPPEASDSNAIEQTAQTNEKGAQPEEESPEEPKKEEAKPETDAAPPVSEPKEAPEKLDEEKVKEEEKAAKMAAIEKEAQARLAAQRKPVSFASAFGGDDVVPEPPITSPKSAPQPTGRKSAPPSEIDTNITEEGNKSGTAFGAAKKKRVSGLMNAYLDKVSHEPLPGDSIPISPSPRNNPKRDSFSPRMSPHGTHSPSYLKLLEAHSVSLPSLDVPKTPTEESPEEKEKRRASMQAFRQKLDETAKKSDNNFEFGESFRQKQRFSLLTDKQKRKEAEVTIKGFDAMVLSGGKTATGEVDTSNLEKTFVFETSPTDKFRPSDGICRVDYQNTQYEGYVFLVHRTRGLILLQYRVGDGDVTKAHVPGGSIQENEFLRAAEKSGNEKIQLQIAARAAAARQLFEKTGINVTNSLDRMKPAVLRLHAPDTKDGTMMLKNEQGNRLYYFLQVSDEDFIQGGPEDKLSGPSGESDSSLKLKLSPEYTSYTFAKEPMEAAKRLKETGDGESTEALNMVMHQAAQTGVESELSPTSHNEKVELDETKKEKVFFDANEDQKSDKDKKIITIEAKSSESAATPTTTQGSATPTNPDTQKEATSSEPADTSCSCNCNIM